jgi:hypothetical protein
MALCRFCCETPDLHCSACCPACVKRYYDDGLMREVEPVRIPWGELSLYILGLLIVFFLW